MNNVRMLMKNLWDVAEISVTKGAPVPTLPLSSSQMYGRSQTAGITPDSNHQSAIEFSLDGYRLIDGLVIYRHWLSNAASWRVELYDNWHCTGNRVYDSGTIEAVPTKTLGELDWLVDPLVATVFEGWPYKFSQLWLAEPLFAMSGRITLTDAQSRDGIHEFDRVFLGRTIQPGVNFLWGAEFAWQSSSQMKRSVAGSLFGTEKALLRQISFELAYLQEEERPLLSEGVSHVGITKDWFVSLYPSASGQKQIEHALACKFISLPPIVNPAFNTYRAKFSIQEA